MDTSGVKSFIYFNIRENSRWDAFRLYQSNKTQKLFLYVQTQSGFSLKREERHLLICTLAYLKQKVNKYKK